MSYRFVDSFRAGPSCFCWKAVYKTVWHIPLLSVQWTNSWWWTEELSETCTVSCQNKLVESVHLVGFIIKKFQGLCIVYEKDDQWIRDQLLFVTESRQYLEPNNDISKGYLGLLLGIKWSKHVADSSPQFSANVKKTRKNTSVIPYFKEHSL